MFIAARPILCMLCLLAILQVLPANAQRSGNSWYEPQYVYKYWNNGNGLAQNTVYDLAKDSEGYLWIATEEGLLRFDGQQFRNRNENNTPGLYSSTFYNVIRSARGIWGASRNGLIRSSKNAQQTFDLRRELQQAWITSIAEDNRGRLWVGTSEGNLLYLQDDSVYQCADWKSSNGLSVQVLENTGGALLIGTNKGLFQLDHANKQLHYFVELGPTDIKAIVVDKKGRTWVGTAEDGLFCIRPSLEHFTVKEGLKEMFITRLEVDDEGDLWIGTRSSGVQVFANGVFRSFGDKELAHESIKSIHVQEKSLAWIGTTASGLVQVRPSEIQMLPARIGLNSKVILPIFEHTNGDVWVGTPGKGVNRIRNGSSVAITSANGLANDLVLSIYGKDDHIYFGTANGLDRFHIPSGRIDRHYSTQDGLASNIVRGITIAQNGRTWLTTKAGGIHTIDKNGRLERLPVPAHLVNADFMELHEDRHHNIWIGSSGYGTVRIEPNGKLTSFGPLTGFPASIVECFYSDASGILWMGTDKGLVAFHEGRFQLFQKEHGLRFNDIYRILDDGTGNLWMSGNYGLQRVLLADLHKAIKQPGMRTRIPARLFNKSDGMTNAETNGGICPAGWKMRDGSLWFPTVEGIAIVHPALINEQARIPDIHIENIRFGKTEQALTNMMVIPPGGFNIEIDYSSIDYARGHDVSYFYRLKGLSNEWVAAGPRRTAYFTSLEPGHYTFEVKAEQYGNYSEIASGSFRVKPLFYQTLWFRIALGASILLLLFVFIRFQKKISLIRFQEQQKLASAQIKGQEKERQIIGSELHDNINQKLTTAKLYLDFARSNESMRLELIEKSEQVVNSAINEIRVLSKSLIPPTLRDIGLKDAVQELIESYTIIARFAIHFNCAAPLHLLSEDLRLSLFRILQEHLNNIVKYADARNVWIEFWAVEHQVYLSIRDDGKGFNVREKVTGVGLANIRNRIALHKGSFEIISSAGTGCTLNMIVPFDRTKLPQPAGG